MSGSGVCLICCSPTGTDGSGNVFEKTKVFASLSELLKVRRGEGALLWWDFGRDPLPFCPPCLHSTELLSELKSQLDSLKTCIKRILDKIKLDILNSENKVGPRPKLRRRELHFRAQAVSGT